MEDVAKNNGIHTRAYRRRIKESGWSPEKAAHTPLKGKSDSRVWILKASENDIPYNTYMDRLQKLGWSKEKSATTPPKTRSDSESIKLAEQNGVTRSAYIYRVEELFWEPEEAATTTLMTKKEVSDLGNQTLSEYREIINERTFNDEDNLFSVTPQHLEVAAENGIDVTNVHSRVYGGGWTVQDAITIPVREMIFSKTENLDEYRKTAEQNGISYRTLSGRVTRGWTLEDAATRSLVDPTELRRADKEWIEKALANGINKLTYIARIDQLGWSKEDASTTQPLARGEYLNEETKRKVLDAFEKRNQNFYR